MPRSFAIQVQTGLSLNQLRLARGDVRLDDEEIRALQAEFPLLYLDSHALRESELALADGLFLSVDLSGPSDRIVGYRAKKNSLPIDLSRIRAYRWTDYWDPVLPERAGRIVLEPEIFYLLLSAEGVCIPPQIAAEMMAYDPTAGELRTHYAGFFDPGFGYDPAGDRHGSRAALEVRARDVSFMVEHRQPVCKLALERTSAPAERLYGSDLGSNYQGQVTMLSKHFEEHRVAVTRAWKVYLSGEIHSDWRERIEDGAREAGLPVEFSAPVTDHAASDDAGVGTLGEESEPFWRDHMGAGVNAIRTQTLIRDADVVVVRFGDKYRQWNAAFDAGYAAALGKPIVTLHDPELDHALKEVDRAAQATARTRRAGGRRPALRDQRQAARLSAG